MLKNITISLVLIVVGAVGHALFSGDSFQGVSHLSGLAVGADGLSTENGGTASFGTTVSVGTTLSVGATTTLSGALKTDSGILNSSTNSTSTTATSYTAVQEDLFNYTSIILTPNVGDLTFTLPASSTLSSLVPSVGDSREIIFANGSTTAGIDITIAGGTGTLLRKATTTAAILSNSVGKLNFVRMPNTDILVYFTSAVQ